MTTSARPDRRTEETPFPPGEGRHPPTEEAALAIVQATVTQYGIGSVQRWGLGHDRRGKLVSLLEGEELAHHALGVPVAGVQRSGAAD
jgi:hypothetical protein